MNRLDSIRKNAKRRAHRVRKVVVGTAQRPRLSVAISNHHVSAQIIDDSTGTTRASVTTVGQKTLPATMTARAEWVGSEIAKQAKSKKIKKVTLDRGAKLYHGRIKALADNARKEGLEF